MLCSAPCFNFPQRLLCASSGYGGRYKIDGVQVIIPDLNAGRKSQKKMVVILVVLTTQPFRFSLSISQLMAKAIPVRGAKFREADVH
ncbi:hypothetical protein DRM22_23260 [Salmonella enterica subsp. enterica serovar Glostrup]|nr:hypothetical protein [Salmonella enterica subsp. enterica serovar Glostrup]